MSVPSLEILILKSLTRRINALSTCSISFGYVSTLNNKAIDNAVDTTAQKVHLACLICIGFLLLSTTAKNRLKGELLLSCLLCILSRA